MKNKILSSALVVLMLLVIGTECLAVGINEFQGKWVAKYMVQFGISTPVEDVPVDLMLEIEGYTVYLTSQAMYANRDSAIFSYTNNRLEVEGAEGIYYIIEMQKDGTLRMNLSGAGVSIDFILEKEEAEAEQIVDGTEELENSPSNADIQESASYSELKKGDKGEDVKRLQQRLIELNYLSGSADGDFGNKTKAAVELFQNAASLPTTGIADNETQAALFADDAPKAKTYKKLDYNALSRDPDTYYGDYYTFTGKVLQVIEEEQSDGTTLAEYRIATKGNSDNIVYVGYSRNKGEQRILENDKVTVYAQSQGLITYQTVRGDALSIPGFLAESISLR